MNQSIPAQVMDQVETLHMDGLGRMDLIISNQNQGLVYSGTTLYGFGKEVLERSQPQRGNVDSGSVQSQFRYDFLGRLQEENTELGGGLNPLHRELTYSGPCTTEAINHLRTSSSCVNLFG